MVRFSLTVLEMLRGSMGTVVPQHGDCAGMPMAQGKGGSSVLCGADPNKITSLCTCVSSPFPPLQNEPERAREIREAT